MQIRAAVSRVDAAERSGSIQRWSQEDAPEDLLAATPEPGHIVDRRHFPVLDATELTLSNGMRICYKTSKALEDQVLLHVCSLSPCLPQVEIRSCAPKAAYAVWQYGLCSTASALHGSMRLPAALCP